MVKYEANLGSKINDVAFIAIVDWLHALQAKWQLVSLLLDIEANWSDHWKNHFKQVTFSFNNEGEKNGCSWQSYYI